MLLSDVSVFMRRCRLRICPQGFLQTGRADRGLLGSVLLIALAVLAGRPTPAAGLTDCRAGRRTATTRPTACPEVTDVWLLNTRRLPGICRLPETVAPGVEQFDSSSQHWLPADLGGIVAGTQPLVIFIHGNRYDPCSAKRQGLQLARRCAGTPPGQLQPLAFCRAWVVPVAVNKNHQRLRTSHDPAEIGRQPVLAAAVELLHAWGDSFRQPADAWQPPRIEQPDISDLRTCRRPRCRCSPTSPTVCQAGGGCGSTSQNCQRDQQNGPQQAAIGSSGLKETLRADSQSTTSHKD